MTCTSEGCGSCFLSSLRSDDAAFGGGEIGPVCRDAMTVSWQRVCRLPRAFKRQDQSRGERAILNAMNPPSGFIDRTSPSQARSALFRSLFRGREDVYPRRFESRKTGQSGYAPACANEWVRGICEKPRIKCAECPHRASSRSPTMSSGGICPALTTTASLSSPVSIRCSSMRPASSLPSTSTRPAGRGCARVRQRLPPARSSRRARTLALRAWRTRVAVLRGRASGRAGPALGSHVLTEAMEGRPDIGLDSYDRLFPNQDTLPQGGFGNLIALPLQKRARGTGQQRVSRR